jgi:hypothetical protein
MGLYSPGILPSNPTFVLDNNTRSGESDIVLEKRILGRSADAHSKINMCCTTNLSYCQGIAEAGGLRRREAGHAAMPNAVANPGRSLRWV